MITTNSILTSLVEFGLVTERPSQRELAEFVFDSLSRSRVAIHESPAGTGKTP